jgi:hypothetical protein
MLCSQCAACRGTHAVTFMRTRVCRGILCLCAVLSGSQYAMFNLVALNACFHAVIHV